MATWLAAAHWCGWARSFAIIRARLTHPRGTEATKHIAARVSARIRERLSSEVEEPQLSVSAGLAAYPEDGDTAEKLLAAADRTLYRMKHRGNAINSITRIAACL